MEGRRKAEGASLFLEGSCRIVVSAVWPGLGKGKQNEEKLPKFKRFVQEVRARGGEKKGHLNTEG